MAVREASIRVNMKSEGFLSGIRKMESVASSAGKKMGAALGGPMKAGLKSAKDAFKSLEDSLKENIKTAATLGGAFAVGKFLTDAVQMQGVYRNIAHDVQKVDSSVKDWRDVQKMIEPIADKTGQSVGDMAKVFDETFSATGDLEYTKGVIEAIGYAATVTGKDASKYGTLMQMANEKFGVGVEEAGDLIARLDKQLSVGGASIDDISGKFGIMATEAEDAGFKGANGMVRLLGLMGAVDNELGEKSAPALKGIFEKLKANTAQSAALQKKGGFKFTANMDALDKIRETLKTAQGRKAAELTFTGDARRVYDSLIKPFDEGVDEAKKKGAKGKELTAAGMKKFDEAMKSMGAEGATYADLQAEANKRMAEDPGLIMKKAINRMAVAFGNEEMMGAIERLAKVLPDVTNWFVKIINWAMKNPMLAAGGFVGAKVGLSFGTGMLTDAGKRIGNTAVDTLLAKAKAEGPWKSAGAALGIAAASYIAYEGGKMLIDELYKAKAASQGEAAAASASAGAAAAGTNEQAKVSELEAIREKIDAAFKERSTFKGAASDVTDKLFGSLAEIGAKIGLNEAPRKVEDPIDQMIAAEKELSESLIRQREAKLREAIATDKAATGMNSLVVGVEKLDKVLQKVGGGGGGGGNGKGPPSGLYTGPGYAQ
jgi:hypothetical protein